MAPVSNRSGDKMFPVHSIAPAPERIAWSSILKQIFTNYNEVIGKTNALWTRTEVFA